MRASSRLWLPVALLAASAAVPAADRIYRDSFENPPDCVATPNDPACPTFTIVTPPLVIPPNERGSTCWYFHAPNAATVGIDRIESSLGSGTEYAILFATYDNTTGAPADRRPPGTVSNANCGFEFGTNNTRARRIYQAHDVEQVLEMPTTDGAGLPVAIRWLPNQPLFLQVFAPNFAPAPFTTSVRIGADALPAGVPFTRTETLMTYRAQLLIPSSGMAQQTTAACVVPLGLAFWHFTTHTHRRATLAQVFDVGPAVLPIVLTTDFTDPGIAEFRLPPFYVFPAGNRLRYTCTYVNNSGATIFSGPAEFDDENCVAVAYYFPATQPQVCFDDGPISP